MPTTSQQRQRVLAFYDGVSRWMKPAVSKVAHEADAVLARGRRVFEGMLDELPYVDRPEHSMAPSMFACAAMLAVFEVLREQEIDAHKWGQAIHTLPSVVPPGDDADRERARADAEASRLGGAPNEFVFEIVGGDGTRDRGMNVTSCAICHLFGKRGAMELVPYMCAYDDVVSDAGSQGLRRTGTIALGASRCDFRFRQGGDPLRLVDQYPDRIRLTDS
jgi:hypothetical protein